MFADTLLKKHLLEQLLYSEIFAHPLRREEMKASIAASDMELDKALEDLESMQLVRQTEGFYFLFNENDKVKKRISGMQRCDKHMPKALRNAAFIARFPYVRGVGISGSLSKGILHEDGDFDYFIITERNRLWVARTLLILYKKLFLFNSRKHFCVNYFIDNASLEIQEKNRFTATEIHTLIPVTGAVFNDFYAKNDWIGRFYQGAGIRILPEEPQKPWLSRSGEQMLRGTFGEWLDIQCMKLTLRRWKRKFSHFNNTTFDLTLKTRRYVSKHHPNDFQTRVLKRYEELADRFRTMYGKELEQQGIRL